MQLRLPVRVCTQTGGTANKETLKSPDIKIFSDFVDDLKGNFSGDHQKYFHNSADSFEFEMDAFQDFIKNRELSCEEMELVGEYKNIARLKYRYKESGESTDRSDCTTWFPMKKDNNIWKFSNRGEYLRCLAESNKWRKIETPDINFYFDSFLKKTLDHINVEDGLSEFKTIKKFLNLEDGSRVNYFVYDDEKSLHDLGFNSNMSGQNWIISNHPCDVFQFVSLCIKSINPELPKYFLYGFASYYAYYISKSCFPLFNFPKEDFDRFTLNVFRSGYYTKIKKLLNNLEFQKWSEMISIISILSQQKLPQNLIVFLIPTSFTKFLFENEIMGKNELTRKTRMLEIINTCRGKEFKNTFKKITGIKIKKAEKLWKKELKTKVS